MKTKQNGRDLDERIVNFLASDVWHWHRYWDVAEKLGEPWGIVLAAAIRLAKTNDTKVVGKKMGPSKTIDLDWFRLTPNGAAEVGASLKEARLKRLCSWIYAYVRDHPGTSANATIKGLAEVIGGFSRLEALALVKILTEYGMLERDKDNRLKSLPFNGAPIGLEATLRDWYGGHRATTCGSYQVPKGGKTGSKDGSRHNPVEPETMTLEPGK